MMKEIKKYLSDIYSKVLSCQWTWADCECCWTYDSRATDLDCWCQLDYQYKIWTMVRCPACSWDYDEVDETPTVSE